MQIQWFLELAISAFLLNACYTDISERRISNITCLAVMILSLIQIVIAQEENSLRIAVLVLMIGFFLSLTGIIGAGDIKLTSTLIMGLPANQCSDFLLLIGFSGIPVALATLIFYRKKGKRKSVTVPYGLAISGGYWLLILAR